MNHMRSKGFVQFLTGFALVCSLTVPSVAQHDKKGGSPPPAPRSAPAPHVNSAPAPRPNINRAPPPSTSHAPNTTTRPMGNVGTRPNTTNPGGRSTYENLGRTRPGAARPVAPMTNRSNMPRNGMNGPHGPAGNMNAHGGGMGSGPHMVNRPLAGRQVTLRGGGSAVIRPNGQIRTINRNGLQINRGINGNRTIVSMHNGARVVTTGRHTGYVQRNYVTRGNRTYVSRTVVVNRVTYTTVYRSYSYRGYCCYYGYHPAYYYAPVYYGWAYHPWAAPVYYNWGWGPAPWYGYYGAYFTPYPSYPSAAFWLTDYLIAANLRAAYEARAAAAANNDNEGSAYNNSGSNGNAPCSTYADCSSREPQQQNSGNDNSASNSGQVTLTPEVKEAIAEEVKAQLAAQQAAAQQGSAQQNSGSASDEVPAALDPQRHTFIVSSDLTVSSDGEECQLTAGDVIKRTSDTPDQDRKVTAIVSAAKKTDCAVGREVAIGVDDLQEMHNKFEEQLDNGMKDLAAKNGQGGLPKAPDTRTTASDVPPPPPDNSAAKALEEQQSAADQTESQAMKEAFNQGS